MSDALAMSAELLTQAKRRVEDALEIVCAYAGLAPAWRERDRARLTVLRVEQPLGTASFAYQNAIELDGAIVWCVDVEVHPAGVRFANERWAGCMSMLAPPILVQSWTYREPAQRGVA